MTVGSSSEPRLGSISPRIGADLERGPIAAVDEQAKTLGLELMPHQLLAVSVMEARSGDGFRYREIADVEARQNGKSTKLAPLIRSRIERGRRVVHTAQNRQIPRTVFMAVAGSYAKGEASVRFANGQEEVRLAGGGSYLIVAPQRGVRGLSADDLIIDEAREYLDFDFIGAAQPILTASSDPQTIYLSNAGDEQSLVLNDLRNRAETDPALGYMEWSAAPELDPGDVAGWLEANPAYGRRPRFAENLADRYASLREAGNLAYWETEHLCRWVLSMAPRLVPPELWLQARGALSKPLHPHLGISVHPSGNRASAALSWLQDSILGVMVLGDVTGSPVDLDRFGTELKQQATEAGVQLVGFDPLTDQHLARYFPGAKPISGQLFANASERFVRNVESGRLRWNWADQIADDLPYVARKPIGGTAFMAESVDPRRPTTAALAAIRAAWLAAEPNSGAPSVY